MSLNFYPRRLLLLVATLASLSSFLVCGAWTVQAAWLSTFDSDLFPYQVAIYWRGIMCGVSLLTFLLCMRWSLQN